MIYKMTRQMFESIKEAHDVYANKKLVRLGTDNDVLKYINSQFGLKGIITQIITTL